MPRKIVFLSHYFSPHVGGVEKHLCRLSLELVKQNYQVTIITCHHNPKLKLNETRQSINILRIRLPETDWSKPSKLRLWAWMFKHRKHFQKADIIHCHDVFFWYLPIRFLFATKPVFTTFHGYEGGIFPPAAKAILIRKISEKLSKGNLCVGKYIEKWYHTQADQITYGAVDIPPKISPPQTLTGITCYYRGFHDQQFTIYTQSFKKLNQQNKNFSIDIYGRSEPPDLFPGGKFHYAISNPKKLFLKNKFVFTSGYLSILEAMAYKRLIFSVYTNPLEKDILTMTPFAKFINISNNPESIIQKINYYLSHPQAEQKIITQAYQWVATKTWKNLTQQYLKLWKKYIY
jgi:glycosyltransferase involved in cell wall biosynthesis